MNTAPGMVAAGPILPAQCRACAGPALAAQWAVLDPSGVRTIGYTFQCIDCHPDSAWACETCPDVLPLDGDQIFDHVRRHG